MKKLLRHFCVKKMYLYGFSRLIRQFNPKKVVLLQIKIEFKTKA